MDIGETGIIHLAYMGHPPGTGPKSRKIRKSVSEGIRSAWKISSAIVVAKGCLALFLYC